MNFNSCRIFFFDLNGRVTSLVSGLTLKILPSKTSSKNNCPSRSKFKPSSCNPYPEISTHGSAIIVCNSLSETIGATLADSPSYFNVGNPLFSISIPLLSYIMISPLFYLKLNLKSLRV